MQRIIVLLFIISIGFSFAPVVAQTSSIFSALTENVDSVKKHRIGWGISVSEGMVTYSNDEGEVLFSMLYAQRISPTTEIELALHYTSIQKRSPDLSSTVSGMSLAWHFDVTFMFQPFSQFFQPLRLGVGPSLLLWDTMGIFPARYTPRTITSPIPTLPNGSGGINIAAFAMNTKAEWLAVQQPTFDIGIRAQVHLFANPFDGASLIPLVGGLGSGGVFLYLRF